MDEYRGLEVGDEVEFIRDVEFMPEKVMGEGALGWITEIGMEGLVDVHVYGYGTVSVFDHHLQLAQW